MDVQVSKSTRLGLGMGLVVLAFVVYAHTHIEDVVALVQWVVETVVEGDLGITKEMLEG